MDNQIRIQKFISDCGVMSRRKAEEEILNGKISVNRLIVDVMRIQHTAQRVKYSFCFLIDHCFDLLPFRFS